MEPQIRVLQSANSGKTIMQSYSEYLQKFPLPIVNLLFLAC
jgi:hypothetical protein